MSNKFLIITGASRGIGEACADVFLSNSYQTFNISRSENHHKEVQNIQFDLHQILDSEFLESQLHLIPENSKICLIHNAFPYYHDEHVDFNGDKFDQAVNVVIKNTILLNNYILKKMGAGSSIIFIGSTLSTKAANNCLSYVILKHAQAGLMKALAIELGEKDIHTCCVCPGFTDTEMLRSHMNKIEIESVLKNVVLKNRLISPKEIAEYVYQCSLSPITNGEVYHVNLGQR
jgi:NAD(P)-dependent dehydrogenase (short-subunit alcohol dehydrogenase family)